MTRKWIAAIFGAAAMALSSGAFAQMMTPSFYGGVELGSSDFGSETDTALRIFGGLQFHPNIAAEIGYGFLYDKGASEVTATELAAVGMYPVAPQLSVLGKLGLARVEVDPGARSDTELVFGVGVQYDVTRNVGARLMFTRYDTSSAVDIISVAGIWRF